MSLGETTLTVVGDLTGDPDLRFVPSGAAVATFTIASTARTYDRASGQWKDGEALFLRCVAWRALAEQITESLAKGTRALVNGRLRQREYEDKDKDGIKRTVVELDVEEIGPSLKYATATVTKATRATASPPAPEDAWRTQSAAAGSAAGAGEPTL